MSAQIVAFPVLAPSFRRWSRPLRARLLRLKAAAMQWRHPFTYEIDVRDVL
jgi:hypothetical protein